jgi:hypothetical protein
MTAENQRMIDAAKQRLQMIAENCLANPHTGKVTIEVLFHRGTVTKLSCMPNIVESAEELLLTNPAE